jgi:hypothetical protein
VFGCALNTATYGAGVADAGVASALVNTNQQVGGSNPALYHLVLDSTAIPLDTVVELILSAARAQVAAAALNPETQARAPRPGPSLN